MPSSSPSSSLRMMSWTTPAAPSSGAPAASGQSSGSLAAVRSAGSIPVQAEHVAPGDSQTSSQSGQSAASPGPNRLPSVRPRSSTPPPKQPIVSILPGDDGDEVVVRLPRWLIAAAVGLVVAGGAFAWSRITPDMSMLSRLFPAPPPESSERSAAPESPAPPGRATEQAAPQGAEMQKPLPAGAAPEATPAAEDPVALARRLQNRVEEKKEQLAHARRNVSVTMYSTSWCKVCKDARKYLSEAGTTYDDYDVDADRDADRRLRAINPRHTVPTFDIDGAVLTGFSPGAFESMLTSAAAKRAARE